MPNKKEEKKLKEEQLEFDFSNKFIIKWHSINENPDLKNKKGYKTRIKIVKDIANNEILIFDSLDRAKVYIEHILVGQFYFHETSEYIKKKNFDTIDTHSKTSYSTGFIKLNDTTFTYKSVGSFIKYWIEVKQL